MRLLLWTKVVVALMLSAQGIQAEDFTPPPKVVPGEGACLSAELIFSEEERLTPQCHASTIVETSDGLVAAWFAGTKEGADDVHIRVARHDGKQWLPSEEVVNGVQSDELRYPCWNPVLFQPAEGPLLLFYKVGPNPRDWWGMLMTSEDNGKSWSEPTKLGTSKKLGDGNPNLLGPVKNKPVEIEPGVIWCPSSSEHDGWRVHFEVTRDLGKTWEVIGPIAPADEFNAIQPSILIYDENTWQVLCRTRENVLAQSWTKDAGQTWSKPTATDLPNPSSGTDAITLADGRQLLVYNHTTRNSAIAGRLMLNVALSDDGKEWTPVLTLEQEPKRAEFSYPAVIQTDDGKIHITYTWYRKCVKHVVLDPEKLAIDK